MDFSFSEFCSVALVHWIAVISPGPDFAVTVKNAVSRGRRAGVLTAVGIAAALSVHTFYSLFGLGYVLQRWPMLTTWIQILGALYLCYLGATGLKAFFSPANPSTPSIQDAQGAQGRVGSGMPSPHTHSPFWQGFLTNVLNPKAMIFFVAIFSQLVSPLTPLSFRLIYIVEMVVATALWFIFVTELFVRGNQNQSLRKILRYTDPVMSTLLLVIGFKIAMASAPAHGVKEAAPPAMPAKWSQVLKSIVEINTETGNHTGADQVRSILIPHFTALGFQARITELKGKHKLLTFDFPNSSPKLLFIGHIDTVFSPTSPFQTFGELEDRFTGPGTIDMKGGIVLMMHLLEDLGDPLLLKQIRIILNDDEETGSLNSKEAMKMHAYGVPYGLVFEPGLKEGQLVTSESGVYRFTLNVLGRPAHSGMEHEKGLNACVELSDKILKLSRHTDYSKRFTVNAGVMQGGEKSNIVCEKANAQFDIRYVQKADLEAFLKDLETIKSHSQEYNSLLKLQTTSEVEVFLDLQSLPASNTEKLYRLAKKAGASVGLRVEGAHVGYGSDGNNLASADLNLLVGVGPYGEGMHTEREYMLKSAYVSRFQLDRALVLEILKE